MNFRIKYSLVIIVVLFIFSCKTKNKIQTDQISIVSKYQQVKVSDYGALGDGVKDDTKALQRAIDFACKFDDSVEIIFETNRHYKITSSLFISCDNITINLNKSIVNAINFNVLNANDYNPVFLFSGDVQNTKRMKLSDFHRNLEKRNRGIEENRKPLYVRISNDELNQQERKYYKKSEFLELNDTLKSKDKSIKTILSYTSPIEVEEIDFIENINITNGIIECSKKKYSIGIQFKFARNCLVNNIEVRNTSVSGIALDRSIFCKVDSCRVISTTKDLIGLDYGVLFTESQYCNASYNYLETSKTGVDLTNSHFILIEHNETKNCGISPHAGTNITVKQNILRNGSMYFRSYRSKILENEISITNSGLGGIVLAELTNKDSIEISGNRIEFINLESFSGEKGESFGTGIFSGEVNLKHIKVLDNLVLGAKVGVAIFRANNENGNENLEIAFNTIKNCKEIGINASRYSKVKITNNTVLGIGSKTIGVFMWESGGFFKNIDISNNKIDNIDTGIRVSKGYELKNVDTNIITNARSNKLYLENE